MRTQLERELLMNNGDVLEKKQTTDASDPPSYTELELPRVIRRKQSQWPILSKPFKCVSWQEQSRGRPCHITVCWIADSNFSEVAANLGWKPVTLRTPMLGGFVVVSLVVIALLEVLYRKSSRPENGGGLVFAADVNSIPLTKTFV